MKREKYNWKSIIAGFVVLIVGIILILLDIFLIKTKIAIWMNIGCSLIASAVIILFTAVFVERIKANPLDEWKIERIFATRAEKNSESDPKLDTLENCLDGIAFGLKSFRAKQSKRIENCLMRGVNIRLLTMDPESQFVKQREAEEKESEGQIKHTIKELIDWANKLNEKSYKGKIIVKSYQCMTLDFYWRMDDILYIGPYLYGIPSQQTITYKFAKGGKGFQTYTEYFEELWNDDELTQPLTKTTQFSYIQKRKHKRFKQDTHCRSLYRSRERCRHAGGKGLLYPPKA